MAQGSTTALSYDYTTKAERVELVPGSVGGYHPFALPATLPSSATNIAWNINGTGTNSVAGKFGGYILTNVNTNPVILEFIEVSGLANPLVVDSTAQTFTSTTSGNNISKLPLYSNNGVMFSFTSLLTGYSSNGTTSFSPTSVSNYALVGLDEIYSSDYIGAGALFISPALLSQLNGMGGTNTYLSTGGEGTVMFMLDITNPPTVDPNSGLLSSSGIGS